MQERPGAQTPWLSINQLLGPDERFEIQSLQQNEFLLAPKYSSQLAALFYLLKQEEIPFSIQGRGTAIEDTHFLRISSRAFSQLQFNEEGTVEVGAGCSLSRLHQFLLERKQEVAFEEDPMTHSKRSVGGILLSARTSGLRLRQESISESLLGADLVTFEGSQIKWGGGQKSALAGPALHKLIWGLKSFPGMLTKVYLKTYPMPPSRLRLAWDFYNKEKLWEHFYALKSFSATWEYLDCLQSGNEEDRSFIFAQISGLQEEMESFSNYCPGYSTAQQQGERLKLKKYLSQQSLRAFSSIINQPLERGEFLWYQDGDKRAWLITPRNIEENANTQPLWKQRFWTSLSP